MLYILVWLKVVYIYVCIYIFSVYIYIYTFNLLGSTLKIKSFYSMLFLNLKIGTLKTTTKKSMVKKANISKNIKYLIFWAVDEKQKSQMLEFW